MANVDFLRTPDSRFADLPGYPFEPHYLDVTAPGGAALRMHYVDEGPRTGAPIVLLHGEPTWSYLYRTMVGPLAEAGHRVLAPDLIGFGRSDKPTRTQDYTYQRHVDWVSCWLTALDLGDVTAGGRRAPRPVRPAVYCQRFPAHRRPARPDGVPDLAGVREILTGAVGRLAGGPGDRASGASGGPCRLRRPLPGPELPGGRAGLPAAGAHLPEGPGGPGQPGGLGGAGPLVM